jgi:hypothetical protein
MSLWATLIACVCVYTYTSFCFFLVSLYGSFHSYNYLLRFFFPPLDDIPSCFCITLQSQQSKLNIYICWVMIKYCLFSSLKDI